MNAAYIYTYLHAYSCLQVHYIYIESSIYIYIHMYVCCILYTHTECDSNSKVCIGMCAYTRSESCPASRGFSRGCVSRDKVPAVALWLLGFRAWHVMKKKMMMVMVTIAVLHATASMVTLLNRCCDHCIIIVVACHSAYS